MNGVLIARENVKTVWPLIRPFIEKALGAGEDEYTVEDIQTYCEAGYHQLWVGYDDDNKLHLVATTRVEIWPQTKKLRFELLAGGRFEEFMPLLPMVEAWAKEHGCRLTVAAVRPGMRKFLKDLGFKPSFEQVSKVIP